MHAKKANEIACQNFDQSELKSLRGGKVSGWDTLRMKARAFKARFLGTHLMHSGTGTVCVHAKKRSSKSIRPYLKARSTSKF